MIPKKALEKIVAKQRKELEENHTGIEREELSRLPYLTDKALIVGGIRGCGRATLLAQTLQREYPQAWFTRFDDTRLGGFDADDFMKLDQLIAESGRGVLLFDKIDLLPQWQEYILAKLEQGYKVIATTSLGALSELRSTSAEVSSHFILHQLHTLSYNEFLTLTNKTGSESSLLDYLNRGAFPEQARTPREEPLRTLYRTILTEEVILRNGIRDMNAIKRLCNYLMSHTGETITANNLREKLRIKAVSTVSEYLTSLEASGLISLVSIHSSSSAKQSVNPRKCYAADPALATANTPGIDENREERFATLLYRHLARNHEQITYTTDDGGCDFVTTDDGRVSSLVQGCMSGDHDLLQEKIRGLLAAMELTGLRRGTIVTLSLCDEVVHDGRTIEIIDAHTFMESNEEYL